MIGCRMQTNICIAIFCLLQLVQGFVIDSPSIRQKRQYGYNNYQLIGSYSNPIGAYTAFGHPYNPLRVMPLTEWGRKKRDTVEQQTTEGSDSAQMKRETIEQSASSDLPSIRQKRQYGYNYNNNYQLIGSYNNPIGAYTAFGHPYNPLRIMPVSEWGR